MRKYIFARGGSDCGGSSTSVRLHRRNAVVCGGPEQQVKIIGSAPKPVRATTCPVPVLKKTTPPRRAAVLRQMAARVRISSKIKN